jgi:hypothetical protein
MFQQPPPPPFPPGSPYPFYPPVQVNLSYWALRRLVKNLPPPQSFAEAVYQQALRTELRVRKWHLIVSLIPR